MVKILYNDEEIDNVRNYDLALRTCAELYLNGADKENMRIIDNRGNEAPVAIKHLVHFKEAEA